MTWRLGGAVMVLAAAMGLGLSGQAGRGVATQVAPSPLKVVAPAMVIANLFVVPGIGHDGESRNFIIDTGSSITLVSPDYAKRYGVNDSTSDLVQVQSVTGAETTKRRLIVEQVPLGDAHFANVSAVVSDMDELSNYLGVRIDGIVGFQVFRNHLLTLDYGRQQLVVSTQGELPASRNGGLVFPMRSGTSVPLIALRIDGKTHEVLLDTGSDGGLSLNPEQLKLDLLGPARVGGLVSTIAGDRRQYLARISNQVEVGGVNLRTPVVDFILGASSVGGELLKHYSLTFDQRRNEITFARTTQGPVELKARRTAGLSFNRSADSWEVASIIPETPTAELPLQEGDRCVSINGEPVAHWPAERYAALMETVDAVTFTFARGDSRTDVQVPVISLLE
jgi:hypothetical protein